MRYSSGDVWAAATAGFILGMVTLAVLAVLNSIGKSDSKGVRYERMFGHACVCRKL